MQRWTTLIWLKGSGSDKGEENVSSTSVRSFIKFILYFRICVH